MTKQKNHFIDLFAGCGGFSLGLEQAGFEPVLFNELNESAADSYRINREDKEIMYIPDAYDIKESDLRTFKNIDLICGGPPCQGFSNRSVRRTFKAPKKDMNRNHLYNEMVRIINIAQPKIFLFENVRGLISGRWTPDGEKGDIFKDILNSFCNVLESNYIISWNILKSSDYGIPQKRERVFMVGIRKTLDFHKNFLNNEILKNTIRNEKLEDAIELNILPKPKNGIIPPSPFDVLSDLIDEDYNKNLITTCYPSSANNQIQKEFRKKKNSDNSYYRKGHKLTEHQYSKHSKRIIDKFNYMLKNDGRIKKSDVTLKFSQKVLDKHWRESGPNITVTSMPDDYIHFSQPRTLSVREWARLQTFPDWYQFAGKRTTGGHRRAGLPTSTANEIEIPKYTQIGNAVPVKLAKAIGDHFKYILEYK